LSAETTPKPLRASLLTTTAQGRDDTEEQKMSRTQDTQASDGKSGSRGRPAGITARRFLAAIAALAVLASVVGVGAESASASNGASAVCWMGQLRPCLYRFGDGTLADLTVRCETTKALGMENDDLTVMTGVYYGTGVWARTAIYINGRQIGSTTDWEQLSTGWSFKASTRLYSGTATSGGATIRMYVSFGKYVYGFWKESGWLYAGHEEELLDLYRDINSLSGTSCSFK
jgi:hypothetical protein